MKWRYTLLMAISKKSHTYHLKFVMIHDRTLKLLKLHCFDDADR